MTIAQLHVLETVGSHSFLDPLDEFPHQPPTLFNVNQMPHVEVVGNTCVMTNLQI